MICGEDVARVTRLNQRALQFLELICSIGLERW